MIEELKNFLKEHKQKLFITKTKIESNGDSWVNEESGTWWPSTWKEVEYTEFDFDSLLQQIDAFSKEFNK